MGAYAMPPKKGFIAKKPIALKRKRGYVDEGVARITGAKMGFNEKGQLVLIKNGKIIGVFTEDE